MIPIAPGPDAWKLRQAIDQIVYLDEIRELLAFSSIGRPPIRHPLYGTMFWTAECERMMRERP